MSTALTAEKTQVLHELQALVRMGRLNDWWNQDMTTALIRAAGINDMPDAQWVAIPWYGPIELWRHDPTVSEIMVNGPGREVYIVQNGMMIPTGVKVHRSWIEFAQRQIAVRSGRCTVDEPHAWTHKGKPSHFMEGTADRLMRCALSREPCSADGPSITVRVLPSEWRTLDSLIQNEVLPRQAAHLLQYALDHKVSILVAGSTGSGKTTLMAALLRAVGETKRVVIMEESQELPPLDNSVSMEVNQSGGTFGDLVSLSLRQRPDLIVVGEVRGPESLAMLQAASTGHPGIASIHANDTQSALKNLERMACTMGAEPSIVRGMMTSPAVPLVVCHIGRYGGRRMVGAIDDVEMLSANGNVGSRYTTNPLFEFDPRSNKLVHRFGIKGAWGLGKEDQMYIT